MYSRVNLYTPSDARIKQNIQLSTDNLEKIKNIPFVTYLRSDTQEPEMGVIAQNVECVLPGATKRNRNLLSNVMSFAKHIMRPDGDIDIKLNKPSTIKFKDGTIVGIIVFKPNDESRTFSKIRSWNGETCIMSCWDKYSPMDKIYIYGSEVNDFMTIDKTQIGILAGASVQELHQIVKSQQQTIDQQQRTIDALLAWATQQGFQVAP